ncbi:MAG: adenylosuccinate lyase [Acidobacteria bacterium]|nr:MAG: adenylosuccinate lyase [Acidobacteriota bacterium]
MRDEPQNPLHERYASREMARIFSAGHRFRTWRRLWIVLARAEQRLGLAITDEQIAALERVAERFDHARLADLERRTRHDVVAHLRHFAELAGDAGGILHLGATSAFVTDNADVLLMREALELVERRLVALARALARFAAEHRALPALAYTHFQPAQLTTVGKRACLWLQDVLEDLAEVGRRRAGLRCRGAKGTTGTQASFLTLFDGDHDKVRDLDRLVAEQLGFAASFPVTGQTYPRKQDSQVLQALAGIGESCHKLGTDLRLLQGVGELFEPFDREQVGSSAMAYKKNPIRAERLCALSRRLLTDSLNGPLTAAVQWLERSLDDSANRRLVLTDSFLTADAVLALAGHVAGGLEIERRTIAARVARELPFMATETVLMAATMRGGDRQRLHETLRRLSLEARQAVARGEPNPLLDAIAADPDFRLTRRELDDWIAAERFTGRAARQVDEFLAEHVAPALDGHAAAALEEPRV